MTRAPREPRRPPPTRHLRMSTALLALAAVLVACGPLGADPRPGGIAAMRLAADLPQGAVPIGLDLFMVPIGRDEDGCMMYRLQSPRGVVLEAVHYRTAAGSFTLEREDAACLDER